MTDIHPEAHESRIHKTELLWAFGVGVLISATLIVIVFTALTRDINPPKNVERIDPKTLHLSGEFAEHNLEHGAPRRQRSGPDRRNAVYVCPTLHTGPSEPARDAAPDFT